MFCAFISTGKNTDFIRYFYYFCELDNKKDKGHQKSDKNILAYGSCNSQFSLCGSACNTASAGSDLCCRQSDGHPFREAGR